jgi:hypothetical protein
LGRLGAGLQVLARRDLPAPSRAAAATAPYLSFRDYGRGHSPLDYGLLAAGLGDPAVAPIVADHLSPGSGYCTPDAADVPGARNGLDHVEPVIRRHAVVIAGDLIGPMGPGDIAEADDLCQRLRQLADGDTDEQVRRLAGYAVADFRR